MTDHKGRVLIIAGSDSGGGAGIQADIKTVTALGGYAMTAITAITVQNTLGVTGIHAIPNHIIRDQIGAVMSDLGADVWKTGMLGGADVVKNVVEAFYAVGAGTPLVVDPVMIAKGGASLLADDAVALVRDELVRVAALVTPNAPEAERLTGMPVRDLEGQRRAAEKLLHLGAFTALVKGGHIDGPTVRDVYAHADGIEVFESPRIDTRATHGTGCTLASAVAALMAQGVSIDDAIPRARAYLMRAIETAPGFGAGHQPLNHGWPFQTPR